MGKIPSKLEKKKYLLKTKKDFEILNLCRNLGKKELPKLDKNLIALVKTQLEKDWRTPLLKELKRISKKYKK